VVHLRVEIEKLDSSLQLSRIDGAAFEAGIREEAPEIVSRGRRWKTKDVVGR
jgi:hypothetical protein